MSNWPEHYQKNETEHLFKLREEWVKLRELWCWARPWLWKANLSRQWQLEDEIDNHQKHYPEYYL